MIVSCKKLYIVHRAFGDKRDKRRVQPPLPLRCSLMALDPADPGPAALLP